METAHRRFGPACDGATMGSDELLAVHLQNADSGVGAWGPPQVLGLLQPSCHVGGALPIPLLRSGHPPLPRPRPTPSRPLSPAPSLPPPPPSLRTPRLPEVCFWTSLAVHFDPLFQYIYNPGFSVHVFWKLTVWRDTLAKNNSRFFSIFSKLLNPGF